MRNSVRYRELHYRLSIHLLLVMRLCSPRFPFSRRRCRRTLGRCPSIPGRYPNAFPRPAQELLEQMRPPRLHSLLSPGQNRRTSGNSVRGQSSDWLSMYTHILHIYELS